MCVLWGRTCTSCVSGKCTNKVSPIICCLSHGFNLASQSPSLTRRDSVIYFLSLKLFLGGWHLYACLTLCIYACSCLCTHCMFVIMGMQQTHVQCTYLVQAVLCLVLILHAHTQISHYTGTKSYHMRID